MVQLKARADVQAAVETPAAWPGAWPDVLPIELPVVQFPEECPLTDELLMQLGRSEHSLAVRADRNGRPADEFCGGRRRW